MLNINFEELKEEWEHAGKDSVSESISYNNKVDWVLINAFDFSTYDDLGYLVFTKLFKALLLRTLDISSSATKASVYKRGTELYKMWDNIYQDPTMIMGLAFLNTNIKVDGVDIINYGTSIRFPWLEEEVIPFVEWILEEEIDGIKPA